MACRELAPLPIPMFHAIHSPLTDSQILKSLLLGGVLLLPALPSPLKLSLPPILLPGTSVWQGHFSVLCASQGTVSGPGVQRPRPPAAAFTAEAVDGFQDLFVHTVYLGPWQGWCGGHAESPQRCAWSEHRHLAGCFPERLCDACGQRQPRAQRTQAAAGHCSLPRGPAAWPPLPIPQSQFRVGAHGAFNTCLWTWLSCRHILGLQSWVMSPGLAECWALCPE